MLSILLPLRPPPDWRTFLVLRFPQLWFPLEGWFWMAEAWARLRLVLDHHVKPAMARTMGTPMAKAMMKGMRERLLLKVLPMPCV